MIYQLSDVNESARGCPREFIDECDAWFNKKIQTAAGRIIDNLKKSPIVLLSGPSGSGKTTTSKKIQEELEKRGVRTHAIGMDDYYRSRGTYDMPKNPDGTDDYESPACLDMELLNEHFAKLAAGELVYIPKFNFSQQMRIMRRSNGLRLRPGEVAIFEGIHALNDMITDRHPNAFKLYISARSNIMNGDSIVFKGTWLRLVRRVVRDHLFRGADAYTTLKMWESVRAGEKRFISPYKHKANLAFDTTSPYECCVFRPIAGVLFENVPTEAHRLAELRRIKPALQAFAEIDKTLLNQNSLIREFVGGGIYD